MQISHIEVRRHPIWQREVRNARLIAGPTGAIFHGGRAVLAAVAGVLALAVILVALG
ncbi:MAG: hypothetical protein Q8K82_04835 [Gemmatimonadaceae bacterium]|nr:hypothetical protein [Gemmatimonadaceae bacterium]